MNIIQGAEDHFGPLNLFGDSMGCNDNSNDGYRMIERFGGVFIRRGKHGPIYRLPNGRIINFSGSTSDRRSIKNLRSELRRKLRS